MCVFFLFRTSSNFKRRAPTSTVTSAEAQPEEEVENGVEEEENDENQPPPPIEDTPPERELQETPKPTSKQSGKRNDKKMEVQNRILDVLERDLQTEADPLEMQFSVMSKRVKNELPKGEQFSMALKLSGIIDEEIRAFQRREMVANTALAPPPAQFQVAAVPPTGPPPPPPMIHRDGGFFHERQLNYQEL